MKQQPARVVLVGVGGYGRLYLEALTENDLEARLAGVCDIDPTVADRFPVLKERGIPVYPDLDSFFARDSADLAILVSPVHFHTRMVLNCLAHGANVLCEKPLCLTEAEAAAMDQAARRAGRFLSVGYQLDYRRDVLAFKRDILAGRFGKPVRFAVYHGFRRGMRYYRRNNWAGHITAEGREVFDSPFTNACAHHFQLLTFLLGDSMPAACGLRDLQAELYRANPEIENYDIAALRFHTEGGVPILYYTAHPIRTEFWGPRGVLEFENATVTYDKEEPVFHGRMADGTPFDYDQVEPGIYMQKLLDALEALRTGRPPVCGVQADLPHIQAVRMVQQNPITPVRAELIEPTELNGDTFYFVRGLEQTLADCAARWALPREAGVDLG